MSALLDFANWVKAAGPSAVAGARPGAPAAAGSAPAKEANESKASSPPPNPKLEAEVKKRLGALVGPYKEALSQNGPAAAQLKLQMDAVKKHVALHDFEQAAKDLDNLEPLVEHAKIQAPSSVVSGSASRSAAPVGSQFLATGDDAGGTSGTGGSSAKSPGGGGAPGGPAPGGSDAALPATSTDMFFVKGKSDLTTDDKKELDKYVEAYKAANSSESIKVDGYASIEGDKKFNKDLSEARAKSVANYLIQKGVKATINTEGHGGTGDLSNLRQNRRATITPPPPSPPPPPPPPQQQPPNLDPRNISPPPPPTPKDLTMRKQPPPPPMCKRDEAELLLKKWLERLAKKQNNGDPRVKSTSRVAVAEDTLRRDLTDEDLKKGGDRITPLPDGDGELHDPAKLAKEITGRLPPEIPKKNCDKLEKLSLDEAPPQKSDIEKARDKAHKAAHDFLKGVGVPESWRQPIIDAVKNGAPDAIDKALEGAGVPSNRREEIKKALENLLKDDKSDEKK